MTEEGTMIYAELYDAVKSGRQSRLWTYFDSIPARENVDKFRGALLPPQDPNGAQHRYDLITKGEGEERRVVGAPQYPGEENPYGLWLVESTGEDGILKVSPLDPNDVVAWRKQEAPSEDGKIPS